jgi:hypothetical protein
MAFNFSPKIVTDGLFVCLDAANTRSYISGSTTWNNLSRGENNGLLVNGPTFSSENGGSIVFDGANDYIQVGSANGNVTNTNFAWTPSGIGNNSFTVDFWIKSSDDGYYVSKPWHGLGEYNYFIWKSGNVTYIRIRVGNQSVSSFFNNTLYDLNVWTHYAFVVTPTQMGLYRNSSPIIPMFNHGVTNNTPDGPGNINIPITLMTIFPYGGGVTQPSIYNTGNLSQFRFYNKALSATEILQNYNATKSRFNLI